MVISLPKASASTVAYRPRFDTPSKNELLGFAVTEYQ